MAALANPIVSFGNSQSQFLSGSSLMRADQSVSSSVLFMTPISQGKAKHLNHRRLFAVQASADDGGRANSGSIFLGGFLLGGLVVGALGCIYAPQLSKPLVTDRKKLLRKLPKFNYDEGMEKTRQILSEKIDELNSAIDDISSKIRAGAGSAEDEYYY